MLTVTIYFSGTDDKRIIIENVIMVQSISTELVVLYKLENFDYHYTEIKRYPLYDIDCYIVKQRRRI
jgi:hypothetical protein